MSRVQSFVTIPSDAELSRRENWTHKKGDVYVAVRHQFLLIETREAKIRKGPAFSSVPVPVGTDVTDLNKRVTTITATDSVSRTIESMLSVRLTQEIASAIKSGLKAGPELGVEFGTEMQSRVGSEIVNELRASLTGTSTYAVSESTEKSRQLAYKVPKSGTEMQDVHKFVLLRRYVRDVYLVRSEVLSLRWTSTWGIKSRDDVIEHTDRKVIPLFRVTWHEPKIDDHGMTFGDYKPEVDDEALIQVAELPDGGFAPDFGRRSPLTPMRELAEIAFPKTFEGKKKPVSRPPSAVPARRPVSTASQGSGSAKRMASEKYGSSKRSAAKRSASKKKG